MKKSTGDHLANFSNVPDFEESPEMESKEDELTGLSEADSERLMYGFKKMVSSGKKKKETIIRKYWRGGYSR